MDNHALLQDFNLSRNKSLRALETTAESINTSTASDFLKTVLSSVTSLAPLDVIIVYLELDFGGIPTSHCAACKSNPEPICSRHSELETTERNTRLYRHQLRVFHEMHSARNFRLMLCADVADCMVKHAMETLERIVEEGIDHLPSKPVIVSERRTIRTRYTEDHDHGMGWSSEWYVVASAL